MPPSVTAQRSEPYTDFELCFDAEQGQLALARSVAAEVAFQHGADEHCVEAARLVTGTVTSALVLLAEERTQMYCLFRVTDSELRVNVSVRGRPRPSPEAKAAHARLLDQLFVNSATFTRYTADGGFDVVSDACVPLGR